MIVQRYRRHSQTVTIDHALRDKHLLGAALGDAAPWGTWLTVLRAAFGIAARQRSARHVPRRRWRRATTGTTPRA